MIKPISNARSRRCICFKRCSGSVVWVDFNSGEALTGACESIPVPLIDPQHLDIVSLCPLKFRDFEVTSQLFCFPFEVKGVQIATPVTSLVMWGSISKENAIGQKLNCWQLKETNRTVCMAFCFRGLLLLAKRRTCFKMMVKVEYPRLSRNGPSYQLTSIPICSDKVRTFMT